jgi:hypothetical protein
MITGIKNPNTSSKRHRSSTTLSVECHHNVMVWLQKTSTSLPGLVATDINGDIADIER